MRIQFARATAQSVAQIKEIGESVAYRSTGDFSQGFLFNPMTFEQYRHRLERTNHTYITLADSQLVGYIIGYSESELASLRKSGSLSHKSDILTAINGLGMKNFIFIDQLAVKPGYQRKRYGTYLLRQYTRMARKKFKHAFCDIGHAPVRNEASVKFVLKHGWSLCCEVDNQDKTYGVYSRELRVGNDTVTDQRMTACHTP